MSSLFKLNSNSFSEMQFEKSMGKDSQPFSSNNTLLYHQGVNEIYYLAAFVRTKVISISGISYQEMTADLNCQFEIDVSYRRLSANDKN